MAKEKKGKKGKKGKKVLLIIGIVFAVLVLGVVALVMFTDDGTPVYELSADGTYYIYNGAGSGATGEVAIRDDLEFPVKVINKRAFERCSSVTSIIIPDSITTIESGSLDGCGNLQYNEYDNAYYLGNANNPYVVLMKAKSSDITTCTINKNTKFVYDNAFDDCGKLEYNEYDNAYYLGNESNPYFVLIKAKSHNITSCTINKNTQVIYNNAFCECEELATVTIPDSVTSIGDSAFYYCTSLTSVTIPDSVTSIGDHAFEAAGLTSIIIPNSINTISFCAFQSTKLEEVKIGKNVKTIESYAFENCNKLTSITIPKNVTSLGMGTFWYCENLNDVYYTGTKGEWKKIKIDTNLFGEREVAIHYESQG